MSVILRHADGAPGRKPMSHEEQAALAAFPSRRVRRCEPGARGIKWLAGLERGRGANGKK